MGGLPKQLVAKWEFWKVLMLKILSAYYCDISEWFFNDRFFFFFFFFLVCFCFCVFSATPRCLWDFSSPARDWTQALNSKSVGSQPLGRQGIPLNDSFKIPQNRIHNELKILVSFNYGDITCCYINKLLKK